MPRILCTKVHAATQDPDATVCRHDLLRVGVGRHALWYPAATLVGPTVAAEDGAGAC